MIHDPNNQKTDKYGRTWFKYFSSYTLVTKKPNSHNHNFTWIKKNGFYKKIIEKQYKFKDERF